MAGFVANEVIGWPGQEGLYQRTMGMGALPSGVYFLRLRAGGETRTQRLTIVR